MAEKNERKKTGYTSISLTSSRGLRGMQSVRASFRLTPECINAIRFVAAQLGIKQKSLFDHLAQDRESLHVIAEEIKNTEFNPDDRIQKTFVISRSSLNILDEISEKYRAPRDALVEFSVQRLSPIISREKQRHAARKALFAEIKNHLAVGQKLLADVERNLGQDDPAYIEMAYVMDNYIKAAKSIAAYINKGKGIEDFSSEEVSNDS
jgi:hypothetical protein